MTISELTKYAEKFLAENYGFKLAIPIRRNNRLTRSLGRYLQLTPGYAPYKIDLSGRLLDYGTPTVIIDTLKHELIHYAVHCLGEDWRDGAKYFENELKKHRVSSTNTNKVGIRYLTKCRSCGMESETKVKKQAERSYLYIMGCCASGYDYIGDVIYDGERRREIRFEKETA